MPRASFALLSLYSSGKSGTENNKVLESVLEITMLLPANLISVLVEAKLSVSLKVESAGPVEVSALRLKDPEFTDNPISSLL